MDKNNVSAPAGDAWDRAFRALDPSDEQTLVGFIRMVVAGRPDLPTADPVPCPAR